MPPPFVSETAFDGAGVRAQLGVEVETVLLCDDRRDVDRGDDRSGDQHLSEQLSAQALLEEQRLELVLVDEPALDEQLTEGPPRVLDHVTHIGRDLAVQ